MKTLRRLRLATLFVLILAFPLAWLAFSQQTSKTESPIDIDAYQELMAYEVMDFDDLQAFIRDERFFYEIITPPAEDFILRQPMYQVTPFSWDHFPKDLPELLGDRYEYEYSVPVYRLRAVEDRNARELHFHANDGERVFSVPTPRDYDPFDLLKSRYPGLFSGRYSASEVKEFESAYDPARVELIVTLIPTDYVEHYLYAQAQVRAYQMSLIEEEGDGGFMMMSMGTESNIVITSISSTTNGILLEIGYPVEFTNRLDVFYATDLIERDWQLISPPQETTGSTCVVWLDAQYATGSKVGFYAAGNHDLDSDGDGFSDAFEVFVLGTDPQDPDSHGVYLSGEVLYDGPESGTIHVQAVTESADAWSKTWQTSRSTPGPYTNLVANQQSYWFKSYMDLNGNQKHDEWEPWGLHSATPLYATTDVSGLDITLEDQPSIWGSLYYSGSGTGDIHVLASPNMDWNTTYSTVIPWLQGAGSLTGDPVFVSFPVDYSITGLPEGDYIVRAFIDKKGNGQYTPIEPGGQYALDPIPVSNRVTGISFTIDLDTDEDGIPDWWEMQYFGGATNAVWDDDPDNDGLNNWEEYYFGTDPLNPDTDGDGFLDGYEVDMGTDPLSPFDAPDYEVIINEWAYYLNNTNLQVRVPGLHANEIVISQSATLSPSKTNSYPTEVDYALTDAANGWRTIHVRVQMDGVPVSPTLMGSFVFDTVPPVISFTHVTNGMVTDRRWINVSGTVTDATTRASVRVEGKPVHSQYSGEFLHHRYLLAAGTNLITITALDLAGNVSTQSVTVIQDASGDTTPPGIFLNIPEDVEVSGGITNSLGFTTVGISTEFFLEGVTDEETAHVVIEVASAHGATNHFPVGMVGTQFYARVNLFPGTNVLTGIARDAADNAGTSAHYVVLDTNFFFAITNPVPYHVANSSNIVVSGHASPAFLSSTITVNGVQTVLEDRGDHVHFETVLGVPLNSGQTTLGATAWLNGRTYFADPIVCPYEVREYSRSVVAEYPFHTIDSTCGHMIYDYYSELTLHWDAAGGVLESNYVWYSEGTGSTPCEPHVNAGNSSGVIASDGPRDFASGYWSYLAGWYDFYGDWSANWDGQLRFIKHAETDDEQLVLFKFDNLDYSRGSWWYPAGLAAFSPENVTFRGAQGFWYSNKVAFIVPIHPNIEHLITRDDFTMPPASFDGVIYTEDFSHEQQHWISFDWFENQVISARIDSVWSDQLPGVDVNRLPGSSGSGGYDYLLMGARYDNKFYAKAEVTIEPDIPEVRDRLIFNWAGVSGSSYILNPANNATLVDNLVSLSAGEKEAEDHVFVVGVDLNGDGILQANEIIAASEYRFKPTTQGQYDNAHSALELVYLPGTFYTTAKAFMKAFLENTTPLDAVTGSSTIQANPGEATHNVGAAFDSSGSATIKRHDFMTSSDLADRMYGSDEFQEMLTFMFGLRHLEVQQHFASTNDDEYTFAWELPALISWYGPPWNIVSFDLQNSFGTASLSGTAYVTVAREGLDLTEFFVTCLVADLYDWNYNLGNPDAHGARVQSGYYTLGQGGQIYRPRVGIWKDGQTMEYTFQ